MAELTDEQTELAYPAMKELRPHLADAAELVERVRRQRAEGYRLVGAFAEDGSVAAVAGFRCGHNHRHDAHRRYLSTGYDIVALHFGKALP